MAMNFCLTLLATLSCCLALSAKTVADTSPAGRLDATNSAGQALGTCLLKHTAIDAEISGTIARVSVTQQFHNPFPEIIEAVYVFPLPEDSAVDEMEMKVGERVIKGLIKERSLAKKIYTDAKNKGHVAALLDQERANIFTQAVANIEPGQQVTITIRYSLTLDWKDGFYAFELPTVVGPRYIPGAPIPTPAVMPSLFPDESSGQATKHPTPVYQATPAAPTDAVPDANRITPPVAQEGYRAGHDLSITVNLRAGIPIEEIVCETHTIRIDRTEADKSRAVVRLQDGTTVPDRDFVLRYRTAGETITDSVLTHTDERGNFFTLVLQPPARVKPEQIVPRELIFVLDTSGSMSGFPLETSKALMRKAIENLRPADRFNLITFAGHTAVMAPKPLDNTAPNRQRALRFIDTLEGKGGTEMMKAIDTALGGNIDPKKVRIVCFLTDGFVGDDEKIVAAVKKHARTTRVFSFGIGSSVNRYLLSAMAREGKGDAQFVLSPSTAEAAANRFYEHIDAPVLTDLSLDFGGLAVEEMYPTQLPDLFAHQPLVIKGRYTKAGTGKVRLSGRNAAGRYQRDLTVTLPETNAENAVLAPQWARAKVELLSLQEVSQHSSGRVDPKVEKEIIVLGTTYGLLTKFTSFVAVDAGHIMQDGESTIVPVPLEIPHGVSPSTTFGSDEDFGSGWGSGGDGGGGGGGFGMIPATMRKRCAMEDRLARLTANGGTPACESAVIKSLDWIKQRQHPDGSWGESHRAAATGVALLAYLGHCETPLSEKYGESVLTATMFLIAQSKAQQGVLVDKKDDPLALHEHAIATMALAEAYVFNKTLQILVPDLEEAVRAAGQQILDRARASGGWSIDPNDASADALLTCLNLQALKACKHTGIDFRGLSACVIKSLTAIKDRKAPSGPLALVHQEWGKSETATAKAAMASIHSQAAFQWSPAATDLWTMYFDVHALHYQGGKTWTDFNATLLPALLKVQAADGSFPDPGAPAIDSSAPLTTMLSGKSAEHFRTCLITLTLEVYYRYIGPNGMAR